MNRDELTRESAAKKFDSSFKMVATAIALARHAIRSGHQMSLEQILEQLRYSGPAALDEMIALEAIEEAERREQHATGTEIAPNQ